VTRYTVKGWIGLAEDGALVPYEGGRAVELFRAPGQTVTDDELTGHDAKDVADLLDDGSPPKKAAAKK